MKEEESWEQFFAYQDKKDAKEERKRRGARDRSQFKKTDQNKKSAPETLEGVRGRVVEIGSDVITVITEQGSFEATLKGSLKAKNSRLKNLVTVGDFVYLNFESSPLITGVEKRTTVLARSENLSRIKQQLIAANIDQVAITLSSHHPEFRASIVDRYLIAAEKGGLSPLIVINKIDRPESRAEVEHFKEVFQELGYRVVCTSASTGAGIEELKEEMYGRSSVFSGQSGVGKSSLINAVTGSSLKIGMSSDFSGKGRHTTTATRLVGVGGGGFCLDTPGIRSFGIWELNLDDIRNHFFEIADIGAGCHFASCMHRSEPGCAVLEALSQGKIYDIRYNSYIALLDELDETHQKR